LEERIKFSALTNSRRCVNLGQREQRYPRVLFLSHSVGSLRQIKACNTPIISGTNVIRIGKPRAKHRGPFGTILRMEKPPNVVVCCYA